MTIETTAPRTHVIAEIWQTRHWFPSLPLRQFQVLFNSLFKVLCIFPSRYLYAIGLPPIFSFRWNLPPTLSCNPKQLDSKNVQSAAKYLTTPKQTGVSPSVLSCSKELCSVCVVKICNFRRQMVQCHNSVRFLPRHTDSQMELFPLQSPLLGESLLVSFPPLNYMLKFSGSSCLT